MIFLFFLPLIIILRFQFIFNFIEIRVLFVLIDAFLGWVLHSPWLRFWFVWDQLGIYFLDVNDPSFTFHVILIVWILWFRLLLIVNERLLNLFILTLLTVDKWNSYISLWLIGWSVHELIGSVLLRISLFKCKFIYLFVIQTFNSDLIVLSMILCFLLLIID